MIKAKSVKFKNLQHAWWLNLKNNCENYRFVSAENIIPVQRKMQEVTETNKRYCIGLQRGIERKWELSS